MKRVSGGALISLPVGLFLASKSSTGPPFSSPLRSLIVNSTRTNFSPHWKKCSFSCRSVFGWERLFFFPWDRMPFESIGTRFSAPVVLFCPKATLENVVPVGVFFWREAALDKVWNWEDLRLSGREVCRMKKKIEELLVRIFENFALQISRLGDLGICVFANEKVWGSEGEKICRWEEDKILYLKKMSGWVYVRNWKCLVKNTHRKVTVCKNVLYILKKLQKKNNLIRQTTPGYTHFPECPWNFCWGTYRFSKPQYHACHAKSCGVMTSTSWFQPCRRKLAPMEKIGRGFELWVYRVVSKKFSVWLVKRLLVIPCCVQRSRKKNRLNAEEVWKRKKESIVWLRRREDEKIWELKIWKCWENLWRFRAVPMCGWEGLRMWMFWNKNFDSCMWGFFLSNVWTRKREGVIYQDVMKRVSGGALISLPVGLFLASKSSTGPPFSSPLRSLIVNSTRTNFSPHWKKCSFSCRSVFGLKQHWNTFFFLPWDRTP